MNPYLCPDTIDYCPTGKHWQCSKSHQSNELLNQIKELIKIIKENKNWISNKDKENRN
jgi:hypothetical protein